MAKVNKKKHHVKHSIKDGPYLMTAFLAEKVLMEADGAATIVRIVDRVIMGAEAEIPPKAAMLMIPNMTIVAGFRSGGFSGKCVVNIAHQTPSNEKAHTGTKEIEFDGRPGQAVYTQAPLLLKWEGEGVYWYDILLDDVLCSRIPVTLQVGKPVKITKKKHE